MSWLSSAWDWYACEGVTQKGAVDHPHASFANPVGAGIGAALLIIAALLQAATAQRRHREQTVADRQRRITESFSKAAEQLGSDKIEMRLGGIYTLERISRESPDDYWTVMETLCAFVRERSKANRKQLISDRAKAIWEEEGRTDGRAKVHWDKADKELELEQREPPAADIAVVLTVIDRRCQRKREKTKGWVLDLRDAVLTALSR
jgi:hypothetical protein